MFHEGIIETLKINIPWKNIRDEKIRISLQNFHTIFKVNFDDLNKYIDEYSMKCKEKLIKGLKKKVLEPYLDNLRNINKPEIEALKSIEIEIENLSFTFIIESNVPIMYTLAIDSIKYNIEKPYQDVDCININNLRIIFHENDELIQTINTKRIKDYMLHYLDHLKSSDAFLSISTINIRMFAQDQEAYIKKITNLIINEIKLDLNDKEISRLNVLLNVRVLAQQICNLRHKNSIDFHTSNSVILRKIKERFLYEKLKNFIYKYRSFSNKKLTERLRFKKNIEAIMEIAFIAHIEANTLTSELYFDPKNYIMIDNESMSIQLLFDKLRKDLSYISQEDVTEICKNVIARLSDKSYFVNRLGAQRQFIIENQSYLSKSLSYIKPTGMMSKFSEILQSTILNYKVERYDKTKSFRIENYITADISTIKTSIRYNSKIIMNLIVQDTTIESNTKNFIINAKSFSIEDDTQSYIKHYKDFLNICITKEDFLVDITLSPLDVRINTNIIHKIAFYYFNCIKKFRMVKLDTPIVKKTDRAPRFSLKSSCFNIRLASDLVFDEYFSLDIRNIQIVKDSQHVYLKSKNCSLQYMNQLAETIVDITNKFNVKLDYSVTNGKSVFMEVSKLDVFFSKDLSNIIKLLVQDVEFIFDKVKNIGREPLNSVSQDLNDIGTSSRKPSGNTV